MILMCTNNNISVRTKLWKLNRFTKKIKRISTIISKINVIKMCVFYFLKLPHILYSPPTCSDRGKNHNRIKLFIMRYRKNKIIAKFPTLLPKVGILRLRLLLEYKANNTHRSGPPK